MAGVRGIEALKTQPFEQVVVRPVEARRRLTRRTRQIAVASAEETVFVASHHKVPISAELVSISRDIIANPRLVEVGGSSITDQELFSAYRTRPSVTFAETFSNITTSIENMLLHPETAIGRNLGVLLVGYATDLLQIINKNIVKRDDAIELMLERWRASGVISPELLGSMLHSAISRRAPGRNEKDLFGDREAAVAFRDDVFRHSTNDERLRMRKGMLAEQNLTVIEPNIANYEWN